MKKRSKIIIAIMLCFVIVITGGIGYFISSGYKAERPLFTDGNSSYITDSGVMVSKLSDGNIEFTGKEKKAGLVFYPGGNVEYTAYAPLLEKLAEKGILCILIKMPLDLAVLDYNAANGIKEYYPDIEKWYIGGHSLGGAMAGKYLSENPDNFDGIILLAAYSTSDISMLDKKVISLYGTADGVMNKEKYNECKAMLPEDINELIIEGGCHSYFGDYSMQKGDNTPSISRDEQMQITADYISSLV